MPTKPRKLFEFENHTTPVTKTSIALKKKKKKEKEKKKPPWISYISNYSGVIFSLRYDGVDVPDTMNVHSIYDTSSSLVTYESREEYQKYIQQQAGVSGSYFGFSAGVKEA